MFMHGIHIRGFCHTGRHLPVRKCFSVRFKKQPHRALSLRETDTHIVSGNGGNVAGQRRIDIDNRQGRCVTGKIHTCFPFSVGGPNGKHQPLGVTVIQTERVDSALCHIKGKPGARRSATRGAFYTARRLPASVSCFAHPHIQCVPTDSTSPSIRKPYCRRSRGRPQTVP